MWECNNKSVSAYILMRLLLRSIIPSWRLISTMFGSVTFESVIWPPLELFFRTIVVESTTPIVLLASSRGIWVACKYSRLAVSDFIRLARSTFHVRRSPASVKKNVSIATTSLNHCIQRLSATHMGRHRYAWRGLGSSSAASSSLNTSSIIVFSW